MQKLFDSNISNNTQHRTEAERLVKALLLFGRRKDSGWRIHDGSVQHIKQALLHRLVLWELLEQPIQNAAALDAFFDVVDQMFLFCELFTQQPSHSNSSIVEAPNFVVAADPNEGLVELVRLLVLSVELCNVLGQSPLESDCDLVHNRVGVGLTRSRVMSNDRSRNGLRRRIDVIAQPMTKPAEHELLLRFVVDDVLVAELLRKHIDAVAVGEVADDPIIGKVVVIKAL